MRLSRVGLSTTSLPEARRPEKRGCGQPPRAGDGDPERGAPGTTSDPGACYAARRRREWLDNRNGFKA
jgi:hypothetical protein